MSSLNGLMGRNAALLVSDPWDFVSEATSPALLGRVSDSREELLLLRFQEPVKWKGEFYGCAVLSPRSEVDDFNHLDADNASVNCNAICIPMEEEGSDLEKPWKSIRSNLLLLGSVSVMAE